VRHTGPRKTAPAVRDGRVQKKNNHERTPSYWTVRQVVPVIDRERPGPGHRHLLRRPDIERFLDLLPDADAILVGLDAILLARASSSSDGWYHDGVVGLTAWPRELTQVWTADGVHDHTETLDQLQVPRTVLPDGDVRVEFTETTARAYQLLHVLLHELGHHRDRMTTRRQVHTGRGETYAEDYAVVHAARIWTRYADAFGW
jgi:hypothetical protein